MPRERDQVDGRDADLAAARALFFDYDGSAFHMDRDGVRTRFQSFGVPEAVQAEWKRELLTKYLDALDAGGNWRTVHFLLHHGYLRHLPRLLAARPTGRLWECCAYLELLLSYLDRCAEASSGEPAGNDPAIYSAAELRVALQTVTSQAEGLRGRPRSSTSRARVETIITYAQARLAVLDSPRTPAGWHWNPLTGTAT
jgi:hypothetical protein